MATCHKCKRTGFLLSVMMCSDCKQNYCSSCITNIGGIGFCHECFLNRKTSFYNLMTNRWGNKCPICSAEGTLFLATINLYRPFKIVEGRREYYGNVSYDYVMKCHSCSFEINEYNLPTLDEAIKAERAGRYEDSALGYEKLNLLDKARALRERNRTTTVRAVQVNINHLLDQVRQGNLVIPYRCPACGATMKITGETSADRLAHCPYCGGTVAIGDIEKFLGSIL